MPRSQSSQRSSRRAACAVALMAFTILCVLLGACDGGAVSSAIAPTPTPARMLPALVVQYCIDDTGSYDSQYFNGANQLVAQAVLSRAAPGQQGATIYVTEINANTFAPASTVDVIRIPAVPFAPTQPPTPTPADTNPFDSATATAQVAQAEQQAQATYAALQQAEQTALSQAQQVASSSASFLRALVQEPTGATDIYGCLMVASQNFALAPDGAQKLLIIASDLQDNVDSPATASDPRTVPGARVIVINYLCPQAQGCDTNRTNWLAEFQHDGAAGVRFYSPAETQADLSGQTLFS